MGTRPEMIKVAPLIHQARSANIPAKVLSTGQHRQMLVPLYDWFGLTPDWDLDLMTTNQSLADLSSALLTGVTKILSKEKPSWLIVQGDTTSAGAAAYAAFLQQIPVAHVEAGLRTYDIHSPFPEEFNRRWISLAARAAFAPTEASASNLRKESLPHTHVEVVGNTGIDALLWSEKKLKDSDLNTTSDFYKNNEGRFVLVTLHRRENFGDTMKDLFVKIKSLSERHKMKFLWPLHMNPNVRNLAEEIFKVPKDFTSTIPVEFGGVHFVAPLNYPSFINAMIRARFIITDSGGVQEEAPALGKPVLIMRDNTERPEAVEQGSARLIGQNLDLLESLCLELNEDGATYNQMSARRFPYGNGKSSEKIIQTLAKSI